jgi:hypothetical protein
MIKRPVPLTLAARRTPSRLAYWRTLLVDFGFVNYFDATVASFLLVAISPLFLPEGSSRLPSVRSGCHFDLMSGL